MYTLLRLSTLLCLCAASLQAVEAPATVVPSEEKALPNLGEPKIVYTLDGRNWVVDLEAKDSHSAVTEFVLAEEKGKVWTEHVIVQYYYGVKIDPEIFFNDFIKQIKALVPGKIEYRITKKEPNSLTAEWWLHDQTPEAQHEWMKIFVDGQNMAVLHYANRKWEKADSLRPVWEKIFNEAKLTHLPVSNQTD
jgi:uncharacterized secreted protein with C-terminal beta-propeller domain